MAIPNPVAVYNAENNIEAQMLCNRLEQSGIEAHAAYDESVVGLWSFGYMPEIHKPQVWVDKSNVDAAIALLTEYERDRAKRLPHNVAADPSGAMIDVVCEDCGKTTSFPAAQVGTVQDCQHCGAYVDVGDVDDFSESADSDE